MFIQPLVHPSIRGGMYPASISINLPVRCPTCQTVLGAPLPAERLAEITQKNVLTDFFVFSYPYLDTARISQE